MEYEAVNIKSINGVFFNKVKKTGMPYITILCKDENSNNCSFTGFLTSKSEDRERLVHNLATFGMSGSMEDIITADPNERPTYFSVPSKKVLIKEVHGAGDKVYRNIIGFEGDEIPNPEMDKNESLSLWSKFDFKVSNVKKEDTDNDIPF